jgi:hypothetical protein
MYERFLFSYNVLREIVTFPLYSSLREKNTGMTHLTCLKFGHIDMLHRSLLSFLKRLLDLLASVQIPILTRCHASLFSTIQSVALQREKEEERNGWIEHVMYNRLPECSEYTLYAPQTKLQQQTRFECIRARDPHNVPMFQHTFESRLVPSCSSFHA